MDDQSRIEFVVHTIAVTCIENEQYFSDLDAVVGDGDFGYSLARGFENVVAGWDEYDRADIGTFLQRVSMTMTSRIGGTSGPIWGTAFLRAAGVAKGKQALDGTEVVAMLRAAVDGIMARGGASLGDKTLLDALVPLTDAIEANLGTTSAAGAARAAADAAARAADDTRTLVARRGRASYLGERTIGEPDPGAVAVAVIAGRIADDWDSSKITQ